MLGLALGLGLGLSGWVTSAASASSRPAPARPASVPERGATRHAGGQPEIRPADPATAPAATTAAWCSAHGSSLAGWSGTFPDLPLCGPGPEYGGTWAYVDQPGPDGLVSAGYYNATPGFQCVELADRFLAVAYGLAPVLAEGSQVAANYHLAYPHRTTLVLNGSAAAVGRAPVTGDVISFSQVPDFQDPTDGHVAIVVSSRADAHGDGLVAISQENVAAAAMRRDLELRDWRLVDPEEPPNAEWQFPYAEWLHIEVPITHPVPARVLAARAAQAAAAEQHGREEPPVLANLVPGWRGTRVTTSTASTTPGATPSPTASSPNAPPATAPSGAASLTSNVVVPRLAAVTAPHERVDGSPARGKRPLPHSPVPFSVTAMVGAAGIVARRALRNRRPSPIRSR